MYRVARRRSVARMPRVFAPAKLNLDLRVGKPRPDGFHPLVSWFVTTSLADELTFTPAQTPGIRLTCSDPTLTTSDDNLVVRAARAVLGQSLSTRGIDIHLTKRIPMGGGLGGGSSDAASTLLALRQFANPSPDDAELQKLAAELGSDVPFFLSATSAICTGRGEHIHPLPPPAPRNALLVRPELHVATPAVYRAFDRLDLGRELPSAEDAVAYWRSVSHLASAELMEKLHNDLEAPAFDLVPALADLHLRLTRGLDRAVRMTGSGSVLFTLFDTLEQARSAARSVDAWGLAGVRTWAVELCPDLPNPLHT